MLYSIYRMHSIINTNINNINVDIKYIVDK